MYQQVRNQCCNNRAAAPVYTAPCNRETVNCAAANGYAPAYAFDGGYATTQTCPATREEKLLRVQQYGFMTDELRLYLNTHPACEEALSELKRYIALERQAKLEYEQLYGPLTLEAMENRCRYDWIACPWPWEVEV